MSEGFLSRLFSYEAEGCHHRGHRQHNNQGLGSLWFLAAFFGLAGVVVAAAVNELTP